MHLWALSGLVLWPCDLWTLVGGAALSRVHFGLCRGSSANKAELLAHLFHPCLAAWHLVRVPLKPTIPCWVPGCVHPSWKPVRAAATARKDLSICPPKDTLNTECGGRWLLTVTMKPCERKEKKRKNKQKKPL